MKTKGRNIAVILFSCMAVLSLSASEVTVEVTGVVTNITSYNCSFDGSFEIGTVMAGTCMYNTDESVDIAPTETHGMYGIDGVSMAIGNYSFDYQKKPYDNYEAYFDVYHQNNPVYAVGAYSGNINGTISIDGIEDIIWSSKWFSPLTLSSSTNFYNTDDSLPLWLPDISTFDLAKDFMVYFFDINSNGCYISGELTSISVVPEPSMLLLLGIGGLSLRGRRPRSSRLEVTWSTKA